MWNRTAVDFVTTKLLPWQPIGPTEIGGAEAGLKQVLSRDDEDGAETSVIRVTSPIVGRSTAPIDLYVLAGSATLNGTRMPPSAFVQIPAGAGIQLIPDVAPLVLYAGSFATPGLDPETGGTDDLEIIDVDALTWTDMGWRGDEEPNPAVKIKWLRRDEDLGLGTAFVVSMLPGWRSPLEENHPVYEESFKLYGDFLLGRRGIVRPGGYFFRPPLSWHGPLYSRTGNTSLIRKNAFGSTDYREPEAPYDLETVIADAYGNLPAPSVPDAVAW